MIKYKSKRYICDCNLKSDSAFILTDKDDEPIDQIYTTDLILNNILKDKIAKSKLFLVCTNSFELIICRTSITDLHFRHRYEFDNKISNWHLNWQLNFYKYMEIDIGSNRADILINDLIIEFQHSKIEIVDINNRYTNAKNFNKKLIWIIDCNQSISIEEYDDLYMIEFTRDYWKYSNFLINTIILLNHNDKLYLINPNYVKSHIVNTNRCITVEDFIKNIYQNDISFLYIDTTIQSTLYHNQRGAGCGKTYESIQLLNSNPTKEIFIYLTKMHSAKEVIMNELIEQYKRGALENIEIEEDNILYRKQYIIDYYNKDLKKGCKIIIGTIDSFMYTIGNKQIRDNDLFAGIVRSIKEGYVEIITGGIINYAQQKIKLNKKSLIIIDEAQDLETTYIKALFTIMSYTHIDAYIIGDKLQSIWSNHNIHTFLENIPNNTQITSSILLKKDTGINQVKRFHNKQFINLINPIIDFTKYNLPKITHICDGKCKYSHDDHIEPFNIYQLPFINNNISVDIDIKVDKIIEDIVIKNMEKEINLYDYVPNNFMFIFPILKSNYLANRLETRLQEFWINKFAQYEYRYKVLSKNSYWANKLNTNKYYKFVFLHKSEEGKSINLKESENASKILSIHASKGQGCEVVFVLGCNERELKLFSKDKNNLIFDSLLHVALTRQKKSLYVGIRCNGDEINKRFSDFNIVMDVDIKPRIQDIKRSNQLIKLIRYSENNNFKQIDQLYIQPLDIESQMLKNNDSHTIIEWGHHLIRYYVFTYNLMLNIYNEDTVEDEDIYSNQFITIINKVSKLNIVIKKYDDYYKYIEKYLGNLNQSKTIKEIPILEFDIKDDSPYSSYTIILKNFCTHIQKKIQLSLINNKLPLLCALETIILYYLILLYKDGIHTDITIMDIYTILYYYDDCSSTIDDKHDIYNCKCKESFTIIDTEFNTMSDDIHNSIKNHYEKTQIVKELYLNYKEYLNTNLESSIKFTYNINHIVKLNQIEDNFKLWTKLPIIAHSDKYVIHFIICASFNKLNFNDHIFNSIFINYLLINPTDKDTDRFDSKEIYTCILTLDSVKPIFIKLNIKKEDIIFKDCIRSYLLDEYTQKHNLVYDLYEYCKTKKINHMYSITYTYELIKSYNNFDNIPLYIINCIHDLLIQLETCHKEYTQEYITNNILINISTRENFLKYINIYLIKAIDDFLI